MTFRAAPQLVAAAVLMLLGTGCLQSDGAGDAQVQQAEQDAQTPTPPLEAPSGEENSEEAEPSPEGTESARSESAEGETDVLDASEFSTKAQESDRFPQMVAEFPDDGDQLLLQEVRTGRHEGYDRIVFDHSGEGAPSWYAEYVDEAVEPDSGFSITMDSEAVLYVVAGGLVPSNAGQEQGHLEIDSGWRDTHGTVFEDVVTTFVHHGSASYYVGMDQERDFRVSVWEHPDGPRLIVDVLH